MDGFSAVNTIWVLVGAALVFFMQAGFAMVETGFTQKCCPVSLPTALRTIRTSFFPPLKFSSRQSGQLFLRSENPLLPFLRK